VSAPERRGNRRPWVCLWSDCLDSRSMARAGEAAELLFYRLLALCGEAGEGDTIPEAAADDLAWRLRGNAVDIEARLVALESVGSIQRTGNAIQILGWHDRQPAESEAERSRRRRESGRRPDERPGRDPVVTPSRRPLDADADSYEYGDADAENPPLASLAAPPSAPAAPKPPRKRLAKAMPSDWEPTPAHRGLACELGVSLPDEEPRFRDYHAGKGSIFADWDAAFRTWLRNAKRFAPKSNGSAPSNSAAARSERTAHAVANITARFGGTAT